MNEPEFLTTAGGFCAPAEVFTVPEIRLERGDSSLYPPHRRVLDKTANKKQLRKRVRQQTSDLLAAYARIRRLTRETEMSDSQAPSPPTADQAVFEVYSSGVMYRWRLKTADNEIVCAGQAHQTRDGARRECESVKIIAATAKVEDLIDD